MKEIKLSFIIPAYNIEDYIEKCLHEFEKIESKNCEFIIVNDGSKDGTRHICKKYVNRDERFHLIDKKNGGLSSARNAGLEVATGEWICFWDGDDWIEEGFCEYLLKKLNDKFDLICFGMQEVFSEKGVNHQNDFSKAKCKKISKPEIELLRKGILYGDSKELRIYQEKKINFVSACAKVFKKNVIDCVDIRFNEEIFWAEDLVYMFSFLRSIDYVLCIDAIGYNYRAQANSIIHSFKPNKRLQIKKTVDTIYEDIYRYDGEGFLGAAYLMGIKQFLYALKIDICHTQNPEIYGKRKEEYKNLKNSTEFRKSFKYGRIKEFRWEVRIMAFLSKHNQFWVTNCLLKLKEVIEGYKMK